MGLSAAQNLDHLQIMGIAKWQMRNVQTATTLAPYFVAQLTKSPQLTGLILADASVDDTVRQQELRLLTAICQALNFSLTSPISCINHKLSIADHLNFVVLLGPAVTQINHASLQQNNIDYLTLESLQQLLQQPILKRNFWEVIGFFA